MNLVSLPAELFELVLEQCTPLSKHALSLTSRAAHLRTNPNLYRHISIAQCRNPVALVKTVLAKPRLAMLVTSLDCRRWPFQHVHQDDIDYLHDHGVPPSLCAVMRYTPCWNNDMLLEILLVTLCRLDSLVMDKTANFSNLERI